MPLPPPLDDRFIEGQETEVNFLGPLYRYLDAIVEQLEELTADISGDIGPWASEHEADELITIDDAVTAAEDMNIDIAEGSLCMIRLEGCAVDADGHVKVFAAAEGVARRATGGDLEMVSVPVCEDAGSDPDASTWSLVAGTNGDSVVPYVRGEEDVVINWAIRIEVRTMEM